MKKKCQFHFFWRASLFCIKLNQLLELSCLCTFYSYSSYNIIRFFASLAYWTIVCPINVGCDVITILCFLRLMNADVKQIEIPSSYLRYLTITLSSLLLNSYNK